MNVMKRSLLVCMAAVSLLFVQCTKEPLDNLTQEESRIYITNYDTTAVFTNYKTFKIVDSIANIENNRLQNKTLSALDAQIIGAVSNELVQRGYTPVSGSEKSDRSEERRVGKECRSGLAE